MTPMTQTADDRIGLGMARLVGFCVTAPILDVFAKVAAAAVPVGQITAARFIVQTALMMPVCLALAISLRLSRPLWSRIALRALFLTLSTYFFIGALRVMP